MIYEYTCIAGHKAVFTGPIARYRSNRWWNKHNHCQPVIHSNPGAKQLEKGVHQ